MMTLFQLKDCYCKLRKWLKDLQAQVDAWVDSDSQTLSTTTDPVTGATTEVSISNGNAVPIVHPPQTTQSLSLTFDTHRVLVGTIITNAAGVITSQWGSVTAVDGNGIFTWTSTEPIQAISSIGIESFNERDNPKVTIRDQFISGTTTGQVMITVDDNGGAADPLTNDAGAIVNFYADRQVVTNATLT